MDTARGGDPPGQESKRGKRKQYTEEFEREPVRLLETRGERSASEVARGLGTSPSMLFRWRKQFGDIVGTVTNDRGETKDQELEAAVRAVAPKLTPLCGVGTEVASALLVTVGDNPERLANESSFAALCGVSPVAASSGQQRRHRPNSGGNRDANRAL